MARASKNVRQRLKSLEEHLRKENPILVSVVGGFRQLSKVGYATGLLDTDESYATQIAWWPLISVLGTFSAGKSTFINHYLSYPLQDTGNQAVDDKFTVVCYGSENVARTLPGLALDADRRFPFYQTSEELEKVAEGEGKRVDSYLQLKTCPSDRLKGRVLIDSPGFDADEQRSAVLRLTNHIIDLSDLVLVFFDARHPEPGAMSDTLAHLVGGTVDRADSSKFLYILNQLDTTAREDNPEEVVGAWQRSLAREGLTAGRFYCVYSPDAAVPIADEALRRRFEWKRDQDLAEIHARIEEVSVERVYRVVGALEKRAQQIEEVYIPKLRGLISEWRRRVLRWDGVALLGLFVSLGIAVSMLGMDESRNLVATLYTALIADAQNLALSVLGFAVVALGVHFAIRKLVARRMLAALKADEGNDTSQRLHGAFRKNVRFWRSIFDHDPTGWTRRNRRRLSRVVEEADKHVQVLNDRFADPSGGQHPAQVKTRSKATREEEAEDITGEILPRTETA